jgi:pyruvate,water dikinase
LTAETANTITMLKIMLKKLFRRQKEYQLPISDLFVRFQGILQKNNAAMEVIADMGGKMGGDYVFDKKYLLDSVNELKRLVQGSAYDLNFITDNQYLEIYAAIENLFKKLEMELAGATVIQEAEKIYPLNAIDEGMEDIVGNKAYHLSRIMGLPKVNIPPGFVVSISGFREYLAYNNLFEKIAEQMEACRKEEKSVESVSHAIRLMILGGEISPDLRREINRGATRICGGKTEAAYFSVRSSALGEDGDLSFAGLHDSFLNVRYGELMSMYKKVLASLYNPASLEYRLKMNLFALETAMPVLYQTMASSHVSGVLYTLDPNIPESSECILSAGWGLGQAVVDGQREVDTFRVSRIPPYAVREQRISSKGWMLAALEKGPAREVPQHLRGQPCLAPQEAGLIVETGLILERYFKRPLDIEWSLDPEGKLWILQARAIKLSPSRQSHQSELRKVLKGHRILFRDQGMIAHRGIGAGHVWIVRDIDELDRFPAGAVLVSPYAPPWLAKAIPRASAIITDIGAATGHMATVAREFRVPAVVGTGVATRVLIPNQEITVDAERNIIYEGRIDELLHHQLLETHPFEITYEFRLLRRLLKTISPLSLTDPKAANFTARGCRTLHDIMRFVHEKAFQALAQAGKDPRSFLRRGGRRLRSHIPLDLLIVDIGGGLAEEVGKNPYVDPAQIASAPMKALWEGLSAPNVWNMEPIAVDFRGLMSSLTRTQSAQVLGDNLPGVNLAVVGSDYVNLSMPLGYHFTALEASIGASPENNYISFRFVGGVTDITRRSRRATLLMTILERALFKVKVNGDLVVARAINLTTEQISDHLRLIGRLIGFTRQLDVLLKNEEDIDIYIEKFMNDFQEPEQSQPKKGRNNKNGEDDNLYSG